MNLTYFLYLVRVYEVAKDTNSPAALTATDAQPAAAPRTTAAAGPSAGSPKVPWTIPAEWQERPNASGMRLASYGVTAADGRSVDISVTALGEQAGTELDNVNRWRGQAKLNPTDEATLAKEAQSFSLPGGQKATVVDLGGAGPTRILGAIVPDGDKAWFFKLTGPDALVVKERENFLAWLKSIEL